MKILLALATLGAAWTTFAQGTTEAILGYGNSISSFVNATAGWTFQPVTTLTATELGCFANLFDNNPTVTSLQVGLWNDTGVLLASQVITPTSPQVNLSRYESITPVSLDPTQIYHLGVYSASGTLGVNVAGVAAGGTITASPDIALRATAVSAAGFTFPTEVSGTFGSMYVGPNFEDAGGVPEPSSWLLLGLGGFLLAARRGNQRR